MLKLQQGQIWKQGAEYLRIVHLERLEVEYKSLLNPHSRTGTHHHTSKKEFCQLLKQATLIPSFTPPSVRGEPGEAAATK